MNAPDTIRAHIMTMAQAAAREAVAEREIQRQQEATGGVLERVRLLRQDLVLLAFLTEEEAKAISVPFYRLDSHIDIRKDMPYERPEVVVWCPNGREDEDEHVLYEAALPTDRRDALVAIGLAANELAHADACPVCMSYRNPKPARQSAGDALVAAIRRIVAESREEE